MGNIPEDSGPEALVPHAASPSERPSRKPEKNFGKPESGEYQDSAIKAQQALA